MATGEEAITIDWPGKSAANHCWDSNFECYAYEVVIFDMNVKVADTEAKLADIEVKIRENEEILEVLEITKKCLLPYLRDVSDRGFSCAFLNEQQLSWHMYHEDEGCWDKLWHNRRWIGDYLAERNFRVERVQDDMDSTKEVMIVCW